MGHVRYFKALVCAECEAISPGYNARTLPDGWLVIDARGAKRSTLAFCPAHLSASGDHLARALGFNVTPAQDVAAATGVAEAVAQPLAPAPDWHPEPDPDLPEWARAQPATGTWPAMEGSET